MARKRKELEDSAVTIQPQDAAITMSEKEQLRMERIDALRRRPMYRARLSDQSLVQLQNQMKDYFELKTLEKKPPTMVGLANYLGVAHKTMKHYADVNVKFGKMYEMARQVCEEKIVEGTLTGSLQVVGGIFILKNHFENYLDKKEVSTTAVFINADEIKELKSRKKVKLEATEIAESSIIEDEEIKALPEPKTEEE